MPEKLVLWKPKPQRLVEAILVPLILLPVGPVLRAIFGDEYNSDYGLAAWFPLIFVETLAGRRWALGHGGEWVTASERLQRLLAEMATSSRWQSALISAATPALILCALVLTLTPIRDFGSGFGGPLVTFGVIGLVSLSAAIPALTGRNRRLASIPVEENATSPSQMLAEPLRLLPRSYLATSIATIAAVLIGLKFDENLRVVGFALTLIIVPQILRQLPFFSKLPTRLFVSSRFWVFLLNGLVCWGIPFAIMFTGFAVLLAADRPALIPRGVGMAVGVSLPLGIALGVWNYMINRVGQQRSAAGSG